MAEDQRAQWVLREGDRIECGDAAYIITGAPIGYGGSAVVYPARRTDTHLCYAIKEYFPLGGDYHRQGGIIAPRSPEDPDSASLLRTFRGNIQTEQRIGQIIHNNTDQAVCIREILRPRAITTGSITYPQSGGGLFAVLDRMDTKSKSFNKLLAEIRSSYTPKERRQNQGLPNIYTTACLMEEILTMLQQVHSARDPAHPEVSGYYFGDLHGGNVCFSGSNIRDGITGSARLIDFGSARELDADGLTKPLTSSEVFCAPEIRPPEIPEAGTFRLSRQTDLFSVGCLMLRCVATEYRLQPYAGCLSVGPDFLDLPDGMYIGCGPELLEQVNRILHRATAEDLATRYATAEEMLRDIRKLREDSAPLKQRMALGFSTLASGAFVGREEDRRALDRYLESKVNPIILWGFPGMGKTELAIDYARRKSRSARVCFVRFDRSFRDTVIGPIADAFLGYNRTLPNGRPKPPDRIYREVLQLLSQYAPDDFLIIDQADIPSCTFADLRTDAFEDLCGLPMHLILTTRSEPDGPGQWHEVGKLDRASLRKMMSRHGSLPEKQLDELITALDSHTLALDLVAQTISRSHGTVTADALLQSFRGTAPAPVDLPLVSTTYDRSNRQAHLHEHLNLLFDLSGMSREAYTVLCCAALLPSDGMDTALFKSALTDTAQQPEQDALEHLIQTGWLTISPPRQLRIRPVVREVCRSKLNPDENRCGPFLERLWEQHHTATGDSYLPLANCLAAAISLSGRPDPRRASQAGTLYRLAGEYQQALEYARMALDLARSLYPTENLSTAAFWNNFGTACGDCGDYDQALLCQKEALRICSALLPCDHPDIARAYSSLGTAYGDCGNSSAELDCHRKALQIRESIPGSQDPDLADSYSKVGDTLCRLGRHADGTTYQRRALMLRQTLLPGDHPDIASSHNNLGKSLCEQGLYQQALQHFLDALSIRQTRFPPLHPAIAQSHNNLAVVYGLLHNHPRELMHRIECLKIRRVILRPEDPKLAETCCSVAKVCGRLGQRENELEYFLQALELQTGYLPETDPSLMSLYSHVAMIYKELRNRSMQIHYLRKAAASGHIGSMNDLAIELLKSGEIQEALSLLHQARIRKDPTAANTLGVLLVEGQMIPQDLPAGHQMLLTAAQWGSQTAHRYLGRLYLGFYCRKPGDFPMDPAQALYHLKMGRAAADLDLIRRAELLLRSGEKTKTASFPGYDTLMSTDKLP